MVSASAKNIAIWLFAVASVAVAIGCVVAAVSEGNAGTFDRPFAIHTILLWLWIVVTAGWALAVMAGEFTARRFGGPGFINPVGPLAGLVLGGAVVAFPVRAQQSAMPAIGVLHVAFPGPYSQNCWHSAKGPHAD